MELQRPRPPRLLTGLVPRGAMALGDWAMGPFTENRCYAADGVAQGPVANAHLVLALVTAPFSMRRVLYGPQPGEADGRCSWQASRKAS